MASEDRPGQAQPSAQAPVAAGPQAASAVDSAAEHALAAPAAEADAVVVAGPQAAAAVAAPVGAVAVTAVLDEERRALLAAVLNCIVPARAELPGAGDLGVGQAIEGTMAESVPLRRLFLDGLTEIELASLRRAGRAFPDLDEAAQVRVLAAVEAARPALFAALVDHTYRGYYTLPAVHAAIGYDSRPPQPLGHDLPAFDLAILDRQRERAPFWRRAT